MELDHSAIELIQSMILPWLHAWNGVRQQKSALRFPTMFTKPENVTLTALVHNLKVTQNMNLTVMVRKL